MGLEIITSLQSQWAITEVSHKSFEYLETSKNSVQIIAINLTLNTSGQN